ncbi:MAG: hypothetical protein QM771_06990 [Nitrospira sp.]
MPRLVGAGLFAAADVLPAGYPSDCFIPIARLPSLCYETAARAVMHSLNGTRSNQEDGCDG